jgi:hypothetical protein
MSGTIHVLLPADSNTVPLLMVPIKQETAYHILKDMPALSSNENGNCI